MQFNEYLKTCRMNYNLTQDELVEELFHTYDDFEGLTSNALSRWERGINKLSLDKQVKS